MKLKTVSLLIAAVALLLTGCWQKSVYPFYKDKDVIFDEALLGEWSEPDKEKPARWSFTRGELPNACKLHIDDGETKLDLDARLFKMGGQRFMDLHSRGRSITEIPSHHLFRVHEIGSTLKLQILSLEYVKKWVTEHPDALPAVRSPNPENPADEDKAEYVLTADTDRLQKWVAEQMNKEGFWENVGELKKVSAK